MANTQDSVQRKGEIYELKSDLRSDKKERKKDAIKRTISFMTIGKDVSELFTDVVNCMQTDSMELKKLVYLYVMNYAKSHPDLAILAVNSFVKDCDDNNPLIRALAVRTMGCIKVPNIAEYLCEPLRKKLNDEDPYVRKTAAVCVVKLFLTNPELVEEQGFIKQLHDLLNDPNPMVISNCIACLSEIAAAAPPEKNYFPMNFQMINKLLTAINECTEWGQCYILDSIVNYNPKSETEAQSICERITSRLSHTNSALVLSSIKVLVKMLDFLTVNNPIISQIHKKMAPPLITMLSLESEIQYIALRNINLITQKNSHILRNEIKSFFVKYNDPVYIKLEKLDIIIKLVDESNIQQILTELKEYSSEVDFDFVRRSVRAIGRCALKVETSADKCVSTLLDLIQTKVSYVVQESIVVMRDIMRKMPNKYESCIEKLCENLETLNEPEARAALIWIIGEYSDRIDNASEILKSFSTNFFEENAIVQLQILTAVVKLFLKKSAENKDLVQEVLTMVTQQSDNPDIRDRGFIYWRLLSTDPVAARSIVLAPKPLISPEADNLDSGLLNELLLNMSTLASIYHKLPHTFIEGHQHWRKSSNSFRGQEKTVIKQVVSMDNIFGDDFTKMVDLPDIKAQSSQKVDNDMNLLDLDFGLPASNSPAINNLQPQVNSVKPISQRSATNLMEDIFADLPGLNIPTSLQTSLAPCIGDFSSSPATKHKNTLSDIYCTVESGFTDGISSENSHSIWLPSSKGKGLEVSGKFKLVGSSLGAYVTLTNHALVILSDFAIQFNVNYFGLSVLGPLTLPPILAPQQSTSVMIPLQFTSNITKADPIDAIQVAVKDNVDVFYFAIPFPLHFYFADAFNYTLDEEKFVTLWNSLPSEANGEKALISHRLDENKIINCLKAHKVHASTIFTPPIICGKCDLLNGECALLQVMKDVSGITWKLYVRSSSPHLVTSVLNAIALLLDS